MSMTLDQIYILNPSTTVADTDLFYMVHNPYTPGSDTAITGANLKALFAPAAGSTSIVTLGTITTGTWNATAIGPTFGGTGLTSYTLGDTLYASGANTLARLAGNTSATKNFLSQTGTGVVSAAPVWTTISASDIGSGQALTSSNDTNVTITLGGTPATSLLAATSLTMGWTGTLSGTRGGTGVNNGASTITIGGNVTFSGGFTFTGTLTNTTSVTFPTSGTLATTSQLPTPAALTAGNDTNVTLTLGGTPATALLQAASITAGWTGQLSLARGGTNANLTASNGGIFYSTGSAGAILAGTATANQVLLSGVSSAPAWSTATYPATTTINQLLFSSAANTITGITAAANGVLISSNTNVPSWLANSGTAGWVLTANTGAPPSWQAVPGVSGAALTEVSDTNVTLTLGGTPSTALLQATSITAGWSGTLSLARGGTAANLTASNGGIFYSTGSAGAILAGTATAGQVLTSGASTTPAWTTTTYPLTNAINTIMYASSANVLGVISPANSSVLQSNGSGVPSWSTTLPSGLSATNLTLTTPALGTPSSGTLTNCTGYTVANLSDVAWTDFSGSIGYTGFSGTPTTNLARYKVIGKTLFFQIDMTGTSNATTFTITSMPVAAARAMDGPVQQAINNSASNYTVQARTAASSTTLTMKLSNNGSGWTGSGTKGIVFTGFYETT